MVADDATKLAVGNVLEHGSTRMKRHWNKLLSNWQRRAQRPERGERLLHEAMDRRVAKVLEEKRLLVLKELLIESGFAGAEDLINAIAPRF